MAIGCLCALSMPSGALALEADEQANTSDEVSFIINGEQLVFNADTGKPYITPEMRTMMPARACLEAIGCTVHWDSQSKIVLTRKGNVTVAIPIGKNEIIVNGAAVQTDTAASTINGRTFIPFRAVLEAYGYAVGWDPHSATVRATELTPFNINGGRTGVFHRAQLPYSGFDGISAEITLPFVDELEAGDSPYVYLGFDWENDAGNVEGGFQFYGDPGNSNYGKWTLFIRQGSEWLWVNDVLIEQGETRLLGFFTENTPEGDTDLVLKLDGSEVIRKNTVAVNFEFASVKAVVSIATSEKFDGKNCFSKITGAKISHIKVRPHGSTDYSDFSDYPLYSRWRPEIGDFGMWFGSSVCVPVYIHFEPGGIISIYKG